MMITARIAVATTLSSDQLFRGAGFKRRPHGQSSKKGSNRPPSSCNEPVHQQHDNGADDSAD
jgi:hypothetical protein